MKSSNRSRPTAGIGESRGRDETGFDLAAYVSERRDWIDAALDRLLPPEDAQPATLHRSMRYSLFCGGKRLRPLLVLAGAEAVCGEPKSTLPLACAVECIHTFSLIHDDLPALDDDELRRGQATNHTVFGEAVAILAGDALLAISFELIGRCRETFPADQVLSAAILIAQASGTMGMVGGQVDDLEFEGREDIDLSAVESIHRRKTGALLSASLIAGAILFDPPQEVIRRLEIYGRHLGLAFQITDDILDVAGDQALLGKPIGSDLRLDKATYPKLIGIERSSRIAQEASDSAIASLDGLGPEAEPLRALARFMIERQS